MLGPLPYLHRLLLVTGALAVCIGLGAWLGYLPTVPVDVNVGIVLGLALGTLAAFLLVHEFHSGRHARLHTVRRHRH